MKTPVLIFIVVLFLIVLLLLSIDSPHKITPSNFAVPSASTSGLRSMQPVTMSLPGTVPLHPDEDLTLKRAYATPIVFYGRIADENNSPIDSATATIQIADHFMNAGSIYKTLSDKNGLFSISNVKGLGVSVTVSKSGYHETPDSLANIGYADHTTNTGIVVRYNDPEKPKLFVLSKAGALEPLLVYNWNVSLGKKGEPIFLDLHSGESNKSSDRVSHADLEVRIWINNRLGAEDGKSHFEWHWVVSVPGGGIQVRTDQLNYMAPIEGYKASSEIFMKAYDPRWNDWVNIEYYVKLPDNKFARVSFSIVAGGDNYIAGKSYLNNQAAHRSLEPGIAQ